MGNIGSFLMHMKNVIITPRYQSAWVQKIAHVMGAPIIEVAYTRFADGEIELAKSNFAEVASAHAIIVHALTFPVHDNFMWLFFIIQALKAAHAQKITVCMPYVAYGRQSDALQAIANMLTSLGVSRSVAIELHEPVDAHTGDDAIANITLHEQILQWAHKHYLQGQVTIVAPDQGALERAKFVAQKLQAPLMVCTKERYASNKIRITQVQGVYTTSCALIIDDIIDTGSTIQDVAYILQNEHNVEAIDVFAVHGLLTGNTQNLLQQSIVRKIFITNTIEHDMLPSKFQVIDISNDAISCISKLLAVNAPGSNR